MQVISKGPKSARTAQSPQNRPATPAEPPARSRTPLPKPSGALDREYAYRLGFVADEQAVSVAAVYAILRHIVQNGDLLDVPRAARPDGETKWLLVPIPQHVLDALAAFESDDLELEDHDFEDLDEDDDDSDREPDLGSCEQIWQERWGVPQQRGLVIDGEAEEEGFDDGDDEPSMGWSDWAPDWRPDLFLPSESTRSVPRKPRPSIGAAAGE